MSRARDRLLKLVRKSKMTRITRGFPGDRPHNGFVLGLGRELVVLRQFHDFCPEGYAALRVSDIMRIRSGKQERFWESMLRGEGILEQVGICYDLPLDDFRALLGYFHERERNVIVECESGASNEDDDFLIGRITALSAESVSILNFDTRGRWDDSPTLVPFNSITQVQFDTPYINTFSKYLGKPSAGNGRLRA